MSAFIYDFICKGRHVCLYIWRVIKLMKLGRLDNLRLFFGRLWPDVILNFFRKKKQNDPKWPKMTNYCLQQNVHSDITSMYQYACILRGVYRACCPSTASFLIGQWGPLKLIDTRKTNYTLVEQSLDCSRLVCLCLNLTQEVLYPQMSTPVVSSVHMNISLCNSHKILIPDSWNLSSF